MVPPPPGDVVRPPAASYAPLPPGMPLTGVPPPAPVPNAASQWAPPPFPNYSAPPPPPLDGESSSFIPVVQKSEPAASTDRVTVPPRKRGKSRWGALVQPQNVVTDPGSAPGNNSIVSTAPTGSNVVSSTVSSAMQDAAYSIQVVAHGLPRKLPCSTAPFRRELLEPTTEASEDSGNAVLKADAGLEAAGADLPSTSVQELNVHELGTPEPDDPADDQGSNGSENGNDQPGLPGRRSRKRRGSQWSVQSGHSESPDKEDGKENTPSRRRSTRLKDLEEKKKQADDGTPHKDAEDRKRGRKKRKKDVDQPEDSAGLKADVSGILPPPPPAAKPPPLKGESALNPAVEAIKKEDFASCLKPEKVKSRWRRWSEMEAVANAEQEKLQHQPTNASEVPSSLLQVKNEPTAAAPGVPSTEVLSEVRLGVTEMKESPKKGAPRRPRFEEIVDNIHYSDR